MKTICAILFSGLLLISPIRSQTAPAAEPTWTDQGESDLGLAAEKEQDAARKLELLKKWEQQYPASALKARRTLMVTQALMALVVGGFGKPEGPVLDSGARAAHQLIDGIGVYFDDSVRSLAQMQAADWAKAKVTSEMQVHALLAYAAALKKDNATAEAECKKVLALDPTQATTSYQLGVIIVHDIVTTQNPVRYSEALYDLARSLAVSGPGGLAPSIKASAQKALNTNYVNYHGTTEGMDDLVKQTASAALPPPDFHILSVVEIDEAKQKDHEAWAVHYPDLAFWESIRTALTTQGDSFFVSLKDVAFPPATDAYKGPPMFTGTVVSAAPKQLVVNVQNPAGDAILKFTDTIKGDVAPGTRIQFKGVVDSWTKDPAYALTLVIQEPQTDIMGLPGPITFVPDAPVRRPRPGRGQTAPKAQAK